jgi:hypothetical protein
MTIGFDPAVTLTGVIAVIEVAETRTILVAETPPMVTQGVARKSVPVIVIAVDPAVVPLAGETDVNVGVTT